MKGVQRRASLASLYESQDICEVESDKLSTIVTVRSKTPGTNLPHRKTVPSLVEGQVVTSRVG